jgi:quinol-cytochrome oxidoreductase complex cytochrome b subunit
LHSIGSTNPLVIKANNDFVSFHPYYTIKDIHGMFVFFVFYFLFTLLMPNYLGHPDNYVQANALVTPLHIVPE